MPISQEETSLASFFSGLGSGPFDELKTVFVMSDTVGFQAKMDISPDSGFLE
jgi:hypothetical protein